MYKNININTLFDNESEYAKTFIQKKITDDSIKRAEGYFGKKLPASYTELLKKQNGGVIANTNSWLEAIYGIGDTSKAPESLEAEYDNWINEWGYPEIGIPFGTTSSGGHDMFFLDYSVSANGEEPRVVRIENEDDNAVYLVADNFENFINMVYEGKDLGGKFLYRLEDNKKSVNNDISREIDKDDDFKWGVISILFISGFFMIFMIRLGWIATLIGGISTLIFAILAIRSIYKDKNKK